MTATDPDTALAPQIDEMAGDFGTSDAGLSAQIT